MTTRGIVVDELAKQLLNDKADADLKTLKDLANQLEDHPENEHNLENQVKAG